MCAGGHSFPCPGVERIALRALVRNRLFHALSVPQPTISLVQVLLSSLFPPWTRPVSSFGFRGRVDFFWFFPAHPCGIPNEWPESTGLSSKDCLAGFLLPPPVSFVSRTLTRTPRELSARARGRRSLRAWTCGRSFPPHQFILLFRLCIL